jgi:drug/metabolite transporter (DMT)-like permease
MQRIKPRLEEGHQLLPLNESNTMDAGGATNGETRSTFFGTIEEMRRSSRGEDSSNRLGHWKILLFGQLIAFVAASANACSFVLTYNLKVSLPMIEMFIMYLCLCLCYIGAMRQKADSPKALTSEEQPPSRYMLPLTRIRLHIPWWIYMGVATLDLGANYMTLLSFRYTSLMSTSLLGSLTIPSVMIVSCLLLHRVFRTPHYIGVCLCILGGTMTVWLDFDSELSAELGHAHSYVGDALAIMAALVYGLGDSLAEYSIKHIDRFEYLFMIGLCGALLAGIQAPFTEGAALYHFIVETPVATQIQAIFGIAFYVTALICYYILATLFLVHGDATLLVLSLQATQFWAILFSVVAEDHIPTIWFFLAVFLMVTGVFIYEICGGQASPAILDDDEEEENESKPLLTKKEEDVEKAQTYCTVN